MSPVDPTAFYAVVAQVLPVLVLATFIDLGPRHASNAPVQEPPGWRQSADFLVTSFQLAVFGLGEFFALRAVLNGTRPSDLVRGLVIGLLVGSGAALATRILLHAVPGRIGRKLVTLSLAALILVTILVIALTIRSSL